MKDFVFTVTEQEANTLLNALGNMPYLQVAALIAKLQQQAQAAQQTQE